jgi:hypothetical protein
MNQLSFNSKKFQLTINGTVYEAKMPSVMLQIDVIDEVKAAKDDYRKVIEAYFKMFEKLGLPLDIIKEELQANEISDLAALLLGNEKKKENDQAS